MSSPQHQHSPHPSVSSKTTVVQLKAVCQQLGLHGYSKFNKAQLIEAIQKATTPNPGTHSAHQGVGRSSQQISDVDPPKDSNGTHSLTPITPYPATPKATKRKRGSSSKTSSKKKTKKTATTAATEVPTAESSSSTAMRRPQGHALPSSSTENLPPLPVSRLSPTPLSQKSTKPTAPASHEVSTVKIAEVSRADSNQVPPVFRNASDKVPEAKSDTPPLHRMPQRSPQHLSTVRPSITPKATATQSPSRPVVRALKAFLPLRSSTPKLPHLGNGNATLSHIVPHPRHALFHLPAVAAPQDRVTHVQSHFLERLFINLNLARDKPSPLPATAKTDASSPTSLTFQGLRHKLYFEAETEAFQVAMRFWIARLHTALQLGSAQNLGMLAEDMELLGPDMTLWPAVVDCRKVAEDIYLVVTEPTAATESELAKKVPTATRGRSKITGGHQFPNVATSSGDGTRYLVIGNTGDVISTKVRDSDLRSPFFQPLEAEGCSVRADWHSYIVDHASTSPIASSSGAGNDRRLTVTPLMALVKTKDSVTSPSGISRTWMDKMTNGTTTNNREAMRVAERAVLSSCVLNSFSGEKLSSMQMDAEWLGHSADLNPLAARMTTNLFAPASHASPSSPSAAAEPLHVKPRRMGLSKVELYLPESHQVVSVHLPGAPTVPALAIVHRASGKSDWVLRETGQVVGDEDAGVTELWQGILGCDSRGAEADVGGFWRGWEARVRGEEAAN